MKKTRGREKRPQRLMNPVYYVFCEGETESYYLHKLKQELKVAINLKPKVSRSSINEKFIRNSLPKSLSVEDKVFFFYDLDVDAITKKLRNFGHTLLGTNPCVEFWFLIHFQDYKRHSSSREIELELSKVPSFNNYKKGVLTNEQWESLFKNIDLAIKRAEKLDKDKNPSSSVFELFNAIETFKKEKATLGLTS